MKLPRLIRCSSQSDRGERCDLPRFHPGRHVHRDGNMTASWLIDGRKRETYETEAPWITWTWLSFDRETRITGRSRLRLTCCICGKSETVRIRIPRWGPVPEPEGGVHPERFRAIERHSHPGQRSPADWALPLRNIDAWPDGLPLSVFTNIAETAVMEAAENEDDEP